MVVASKLWKSNQENQQQQPTECSLFLYSAEQALFLAQIKQCNAWWLCELLAALGSDP